MLFICPPPPPPPPPHTRSWLWHLADFGPVGRHPIICHFSVFALSVCARPPALLGPTHTQLRRLLEQQQYVEAVQYRKNKTHFIFTIESTGILPPEELLDRSVGWLV